jgi:hypothetical protein
MDDPALMVAWLREAMDAAEGVVKALPSGPWRWEKTENDEYESLLGADGTYVVSSSDAEGYQSWIDKRPGFDSYLQLIQPAAVLRRIAADRKLLDDLLGEKHRVCEDTWYHCQVADEEGDRDGNQECGCGRDARVARRVRLLAESWGWTEEPRA